MKFGVRNINLKSSFKARTTGKLKRRAKRAVNPFYGKKGMSWVKNPKKAARNAIYHRTTIGVGDIFKSLTKNSKKKATAKATPKQMAGSTVTSRTFQESKERFQAVNIKKKTSVQPQEAQIDAASKTPEAKPHTENVSWVEFFIALGAIAALIGAAICLLFVLVGIFNWNNIVGDSPVGLALAILLFAIGCIFLIKLFMAASNKLKK